MLIFRKLLFLAAILLLSAYRISAQTEAAYTASEFEEIYNKTQEKLGVDQQLINGVYFEDVYRGSKGHPYFVSSGFNFESWLSRDRSFTSLKGNSDVARFVFDDGFSPDINKYFLEGGFQPGKVIFKDKEYDNVYIKYDIYKQQILILHQREDVLIKTILTDEFISGFTLFGLEFRKISLGENEPAYYQVINANKSINCFYHYYKDRNERIKDDDTKLYIYTANKRKSYVEIEGVVSKYTGNRSFIKIFPDYARHEIKNYLKSSDMKVKIAGDEEMLELLNFCQNLIQKR